jgi:hypothetical protein
MSAHHPWVHLYPLWGPKPYYRDFDSGKKYLPMFLQYDTDCMDCWRRQLRRQKYDLIRKLWEGCSASYLVPCSCQLAQATCPAPLLLLLHEGKDCETFPLPPAGAAAYLAHLSEDNCIICRLTNDIYLSRIWGHVMLQVGRSQVRDPMR